MTINPCQLLKKHNVIADFDGDDDKSFYETYLEFQTGNVKGTSKEVPSEVAYEIVKIFRSGVIQEDSINMDNIHHYLIASRHSNPLKSMCEEKLIRLLSPQNCWQMLTYAETFDLQTLKSEVINLLRMGYWKDWNKSVTPIVTIIGGTDGKYEKYVAVFSVNHNIQALKVTVLDSKLQVRCHRYIKQSKKITTYFQACSLHKSDEDTTVIFWSCGKTFYCYDTILNKNKRCKPVKCRRCNFNMVEHNKNCYLIGGTFRGQQYRDIICYDSGKKRWKRVAELPKDVKTSKCSCVSLNDLIYIVAVTNESNSNNGNRNKNGLIICTINPFTKKVDIAATFPLMFDQFKTCALGVSIYIASNSGDFVRFNTEDNSLIVLQSQEMQCSDFGMYSSEHAIYLVGGMNKNGQYNDFIRKYSLTTGCWLNHQKTLPDRMPVYSTCIVKVPKGVTIVPFYENNHMEIK